jgi:hypothetical protein
MKGCLISAGFADLKNLDTMFAAGYRRAGMLTTSGAGRCRRHR